MGCPFRIGCLSVKKWGLLQYCIVLRSETIQKWFYWYPSAQNKFNYFRCDCPVQSRPGQQPQGRCVYEMIVVASLSTSKVLLFIIGQYCFIQKFCFNCERKTLQRTNYFQLLFFTFHIFWFCKQEENGLHGGVRKVSEIW